MKSRLLSLAPALFFPLSALAGNVYHVTAYSLETEGDGLSWESPMSLTKAVSVAQSGDRVLLKAGEYDVLSGLTLSKGISLEGGYKGEGMELDGENPISILTQKTSPTEKLCELTAGAGETVSFKRLQIEKAKHYGIFLDKLNGCNVYVDSCNFISNGISVASGNAGKGMRLWDRNSKAEFTITNCLFAYNAASSGYGEAALALVAGSRASIVDCVFYANGYRFGGSAGTAYPQGSAIALWMPTAILRCEFRANAGQFYTTDTAGGVIYFNNYPGSASGSSVSNCLFAGNMDRAKATTCTPSQSGALVVNLGNKARAITVYGSTFAYNLSDTPNGAGAIGVTSGTVNISDCVFGGNMIGTDASSLTTGGRDIKVGANGVVNIEYSVLGGPKNEQVYSQGEYNEGTGVVYADPLFVTRPESLASVLVRDTASYFKDEAAAYEAVGGIDVHLLSKAGYVVNGAADDWLEADVNSPAIDAGDPSGAWQGEPEPNGSRRNAGVYGGTAESSKTFASAVDMEFTEIKTGCHGEYSCPQIEFTVSGDDGCIVNATVVFEISGVEGAISANIDCETGGTYSYNTMPRYFEKGATVRYYLSGVSSAGTVIPKEGEFVIEADPPPWWNAGGGEGVLHIWTEAPGDESGSDWNNACRSWAKMLELYSLRKPREIWVIDLPQGENARFDLTTDVVMRGGFTYLCSSPEDRSPGAVTVVSGAERYGSPALFYINNTKGKFTLERFVLEKSKAKGLYKTGAGDLELRDCSFVANGHAGNGRDGVSGSGFYVTGGGSVTVSNCVVAGNGVFNRGVTYSLGEGTGAHFVSLRRVTVDDCTFITNGTTVCKSTAAAPGYYGSCGTAAYFKDAPATVRGCSFLANHGVCNAGGSLGGFGGAVRFQGGCSGSAMTNCVIAGCSDRGYPGSTGSSGGALLVNLSSRASTLDLVNVTIACNLSDGVSAPGGINILKGTVNLGNSIVCNNFCSRRSGVESRFGADVDVKADGCLNAVYTLFSSDSTDSVSAAEGAGVSLGEGVVYGDAMFMTGQSAVTGHVVDPFNDGSTYFSDNDDTHGFLASLNLHLAGGRGYVDEKTGKLDISRASRAHRSPAIDAGCPASDFSGEPDNLQGWHGRRVNLGFYGNTEWATMSTYPGAGIYLR